MEEFRSLAEIYGKPHSPQQEAEWAAVNRVCDTVPGDVQSLATLLLILEKGCDVQAHMIHQGCRGEETHMKAYGMMIDSVEFLFHIGVSTEQFNAAQNALIQVQQSIRSAG